MTVEFIYTPNDIVRIPGLDNMQGMIETCSIKAGNIHQYLVSYWNEGSRRSEWCGEHEITKP